MRTQRSSVCVRTALVGSALLAAGVVGALAPISSWGADDPTPTATTAATATTGSSPQGTGSDSVISLGSTWQAVFVIAIVGGLAAVWFGLIVYDRVSANKRLDKLLPALLRDVKPRDTDAALSVKEIRALASAIRESPKGAQGLTRTTIALGLLALVGVALTALLVGDANAAGDLLKMVVTALTTALTTVLGFYFGAKTAEDAAASGAGAGKGAPGPVDEPTVPGPPTGVSAVAGDGQAELSFTPPSNTGGSPITGYTVTSTPGAITATGEASPIVVPGLENGVDYVFTVRATNALGDGPESEASGTVTPQG
jgi:Fibronectin type III domain